MFKHGLLYYDLKMSEDFRGRSNKCKVEDVEIKKSFLRCFH